MPKADGKTILERFNQRYKIDKKTGCWNWTAGKNGKGYGYIWTGPARKGDTLQAYKVGYVLLRGIVPFGMELHHVCENPACVNPDHLEIKTVKEHRRTGKSVVALNAQKTACKRGHEFTDSNTRKNKNGSRVCRTCESNRLREAYIGRKAVGYSL